MDGGRAILFGTMGFSDAGLSGVGAADGPPG